MSKEHFPNPDQQPVHSDFLLKPVQGSLAAIAKSELGVENSDIDWQTVATLSKPVPKHEKGSRGLRIWTQSQAEIAKTQTEDGHNQRLLGVLFTGNEKFGLVADAPSDAGLPTRFYLTSIGDNRQDATPLRFVDFDELKQLRPEGYIQQWQDITIGRNAGNNVVSRDEQVSGSHAAVRVAPTDIELFDDNSTNGVSLFTADLFNYTGHYFDQKLVEAWDYLQANPNSWSGAQGAQNVLAG